MFSSLFKRHPKTMEAPAPLTLAIEDWEVTLILRKNPRARRLILRRGGQENHFKITLPPGCNRDHAIEFALKNRDWIAAQLREAPKPKPIEHGSMLPLRGQMFKVEHKPDARGVVWLEENAGADTAQLICVAGKQEHLERRLKDWIKKQARTDLNNAALKYAQQLGVTYKRVSVRDTTSRWGSCSTSGNLSFSWRLILAPSQVLDYVAAHEVAHLIEMNHSKSFWNIVRELDPEYKKNTAWLKKNGRSLHQYFG